MTPALAPDPAAPPTPRRLSSRRSRGRGRALAAVGLVVTLGGCGTGLHNENWKESSTADGDQIKAGPLQIRNVVIDAPANAGDPALVSFGLYAQNGSDTLQTVTTDLSGNTPLQLQSVSGGSSHPVQTVHVADVTQPGALSYTAAIPAATTALRPATYHNVYFTFAKQGQVRISAPVQTVGTASPGATPAATASATPVS